MSAQHHQNASAQDSQQIQSVDKIIIGPRMQAMAEPIEDALTSDFQVTSPHVSLDFIRAIQSSPPPLACIVLNLCVPHGRSVDLVINDAAKALDARPDGNRCRFIVLTDSAESAAACRKEHPRIDAAHPRPNDWGQLFNYIRSEITNRDEGTWETLTPVQKGLLKQSRRNMEKLSMSAASGEALDQSALADISTRLIEATRGHQLNGALDQLRAHHADTFGHSLRVAGLMTAFGIHAGFREADLEIVAQAGLCHDLGKCAVPDTILGSPKKLSDEEFEVMRRHPEGARKTLSRTDWIDPLVRICMECHHEKLDGTGYPRGLKGAQIHDLAQICALADVYAALTERRSYKPSLSVEESLGIMDKMAGGHLSPDFLKVFKEVVGG